MFFHVVYNSEFLVGLDVICNVDSRQGTLLEQVYEEVEELDQVITPTRRLEPHLIQAGEHHVASECLNLFFFYVLSCSFVDIRCHESKVNQIDVHGLKEVFL